MERPSSRTWQRDASLGANTLTIANGHVIDALRFVAGNFARVACLVTTQARQWYETDTKQLVDVTSPDNVLVSGQAGERRGGFGPCRCRPLGRQRLPDGDLRAGRHAGRHRRCLVAARRDAAPAGRAWRPRAERPGRSPSASSYVPADFPRGDPFNVGQMYALFAEAIRTGQNRLPTFDTAVDLHHFVDAIKQASDTGRELPVA